MSQFLFLNLKENALNQDVLFSTEPFCLCCLERNVPFINLSTCIHSYFLKNFAEIKIEIPEFIIFVCYICHSVLKKIDKFKQQVSETFYILNTQYPNIPYKPKHNSLQTKILEINDTISEALFNDDRLKTEKKTNANEIPSSSSFDIHVEVKEEDVSDIDNDIPLVHLKHDSENEYSDGKSTDKIFNKKKKSGPSKFSGKVKVIMLSNSEMQKCREVMAKSNKYLKFPFKCENCIIGFDYEELLQEHMKNRHDTKNGSYKCSICKSVLSSIKSYREHVTRHKRRFECRACGRQSKLLNAMLKHYSEAHTDTQPKQHACADCEFVTDNYRQFRYHREKHQKKPQCAQCGKTFVNKSGLKVHELNQLTNTIRSIHKNTRVFTCQPCGKLYRCRSGLLAHMVSVHGQRPLNRDQRQPGDEPLEAFCVKCRLSFKSITNLKKHLRTHTNHRDDPANRNSFVCDECGLKFFTKKSLHSHIETRHRQSQRVSCDRCDKSFINKQGLTRHVSFVHEKRRPPKNKMCQYCGRGFTTNLILAAHIRTHTGERPLQCAHCAATFAHPAARYTHVRLLHANVTG